MLWRGLHRFLQHAVNEKKTFTRKRIKGSKIMSVCIGNILALQGLLPLLLFLFRLLDTFISECKCCVESAVTQIVKTVVFHNSQIQYL